MNHIFVFGSNLAGRHGKGSALEALQKHGAVYGHGEGRQGDSYGIPTKDRQLKTLPLAEIQVYVDRFLTYAREHPELTFDVCAIGCGLAGYAPKDIAPMFAYAPANCNLRFHWLPPRTQAEIQRAAQIFGDALNSRAAMADRSTVPSRTAGQAVYEALRWVAGEDNTFASLLDRMERIEAERAGTQRAD
jgi:hypothetical protein